MEILAEKSVMSSNELVFPASNNLEDCPVKSFVRVEKIKAITWDDFVNKVYLPHIKIKRKSWDADLKAIQIHISPIFANRFLYEIEECEVEKWLGNLIEKKFSTMTINRLFAIFKRVCTLAEKQGYIPAGKSPFRNMTNVEIQKRTKPAFSERKLKHIESYLKKSDKIDALIIRLIMAANISKGEALNAKWSNIFLDKDMMELELPKSGRKRKVALSDVAKQVLSEIPRNPDCDWLFRGRDKDKHFTDIYIFWNNMRNELGMPGMRLQDLRSQRCQ